MSNAEPAPRIFIGSSSESLSIAKGIKSNLEDRAEVRIWNEGMFTSGRYTLEEMLEFAESFDFAIFVWNGDDAIISRGAQFITPRDNVILEAGLFYGKLGRERVFLCAPRGAAVKAPTDLLGLNILSFKEPSDGNYRSATSSVCAQVEARMTVLAHHVNHRNLEDLKISTPTYESFHAARGRMVEACTSARTIKIFCNKGLAFFGLDDSLISMAELREYSHLRQIRILLMDPESPWINSGFLALRHYESVESYKHELASSHAIVESSMARFSSMLHLVRSGIRYHRVEPYFRLLMTEEVAFASSYSEHPSVQVRDLPVFEYRAYPGSLYWAFKRHFNDVWHNGAHLGTPSMLPTTGVDLEVSAGGILFATVDQKTYVALLQREDGSWVLPKGHRGSPNEDLRGTALREVCEELGLDQRSIEVSQELDEYAADETAAKYGGRKVTYFFVMRHSGAELPTLKTDIDHREAKWWDISTELPYMHYAYQRTLLAETAQRMYSTIIEFVL